MRLRLFLLPILALALTACGTSANTGTSAPGGDRQQLRDGYTQYQQHHYDAAETAATAYLKKQPTGANADEAYYLRGLARLAKGNTGPAAEDLHAAIARTSRPDVKAKAYRALGDIAYDGTHWREASGDYEQALQSAAPGALDPDDAAYLNYHVGAARQAVGDWSGAGPFLQKAAATHDPTWTPRANDRLQAHYFALQFGAYQSLANANTRALKLRSAGVNAGIVRDDLAGKPIWKVQAGGYATWAAADSARARLLPRFPVVTIVP